MIKRIPTEIWIFVITWYAASIATGYCIKLIDSIAGLIVALIGVSVTTVIAVLVGGAR